MPSFPVAPNPIPAPVQQRINETLFRKSQLDQMYNIFMANVRQGAVSASVIDQTKEDLRNQLNTLIDVLDVLKSEYDGNGPWNPYNASGP